MNRAVMISIRPKWVEKILNGEKTIEVRKTKPNLETPFKCYIYCTKGKYFFFKEQIGLGEFTGFQNVPDTMTIFNGKVIGDFTCDYIYKYKLNRVTFDYYIDKLKTKSHAEYNEIKTCLTSEEMFDYGKGKPLYGWHISDLKIYDQPKEIGEFHKYCYGLCGDCIYGGGNCEGVIETVPQSWCYIKV